MAAAERPGRPANPEAELARQAREGDEPAFTLLVERYQGPVYGLCCRYLRGADAEDAAQDTFVRAFVHIRSFDPERPLRPWLLAIARRVCLDRLRKKAPTPEEEIERLAPPDPRPDAEQNMAAREELIRLQRALRALPEGQREAVALFHLHDMPYREIAKQLDVPIGTVMTWLHRGRAQLREILSETRGAVDPEGGQA